jgi:hypothetical protein
MIMSPFTCMFCRLDRPERNREHNPRLLCSLVVNKESRNIHLELHLIRWDHRPRNASAFSVHVAMSISSPVFGGSTPPTLKDSRTSRTLSRWVWIINAKGIMRLCQENNQLRLLDRDEVHTCSKPTVFAEVIRLTIALIRSGNTGSTASFVFRRT